jgi:hypothetical protein
MNASGNKTTGHLTRGDLFHSMLQRGHSMLQRGKGQAPLGK